MSCGIPTLPCRILIVDDHPTFRRGLTQLIATEEGLTICGEAANTVQGISAARDLKPDLVILDISLPGSNGLELIKMILTELPQTPILVLSVHDESRFAIRAVRAGAKGYLMKSETPAQILSAIRTLLAGGTYLSLSLAERLIFKTIQSIDAGAGSPIDDLSDRELEVFQRLGEGLGTREIAELLHLSMKTVETHRAHIKEKLACKSGSEVVQFAIDWVTRESV